MLVGSLDLNAGILMSSVTDRIVNGRSASRYHESHTTVHSPQLREDQSRDHGLALLPHASRREVDGSQMTIR